MHQKYNSSGIIISTVLYALYFLFRLCIPVIPDKENKLSGVFIKFFWLLKVLFMDVGNALVFFCTKKNTKMKLKIHEYL